MSAVKGFTKCPNDILFSRKLTPNAKLLYTSLNYWDRGHGRGCFASKETISSMVGLSLFQVRNALRELTEELLITIEKRGQGKTDVIFLTSRLKVSSTLPSIIVEEDVNEEELDPKTIEDVVESKKNTEKTAICSQGAPNDIKPLPIHQESTERLHTHLKGAIRPQSYSSWFERKTAVSYEDKTTMTIRCKTPFVAEWIKSYYTNLIESITGKQVVFETELSISRSERNSTRCVYQPRRRVSL